MPRVSLNPHLRSPDSPDPGGFAESSNTPAWTVAGEDRESDRPDRHARERREDALLAFNSEQGAIATLRKMTASPPAALTSSRTGVTPAGVAVALLAMAVGAAGTAGYSRWRPAGEEPPAPAATGEGRAIIISSPSGALVFIDGVARGATPLDLFLPIGTHTLQLQNGAAVRTLPLDVQASQATSHYIELPAAASPPATLVESPPARTPPLAVRVDLPSRPAAPRTPPETRRTTSSTTTTATTPPASATTEGSLTIDAPFRVQVLENGRAVGTTGGAPLKLSAGVHTLELTSPTFEFRTTLTVTIGAGETTRLPVTVPNGSLSVNALPWAEVFVDGRSIGTTPLANVPVAVGSREILWRHPQFGDRRQMVNVTARSPVRVGTDFSR